MTETILAVDLGTSRIRAGLFDRRGRSLATRSREHPTRRPEPGAAEQDPADWPAGFHETVRGVLAEVGPASVAGLALSGQMHGTVLADEKGNPIRPAVVWCDLRGGDAARRILRDLGRETYYSIAGNPLASGFQAATLAFLREREPESLERAATVLLPKDWLVFQLTGTRGTEPTDAVSTGLLDLDLGGKGRIAWSRPVLEYLGLSEESFPTILPSILPGIALSAEAAERCGLPAGLPILAFGGDAVMGAGIAFRREGEGDAVALLSTGGQLLVSRDRPRAAPERGVHLLPQVEAGRWYSMAAFLAAGLSLAWWRDCLAAVAGKDLSVEDLLSRAEQVPPGCEGAGFLPHIAGERTPYLAPNARGTFFGLSVEHGVPHMTRAVLEGVAFSFRQGFEILEETGGPIRSIALGGGGAKSRLWRRILTDALGREVDVLDDVQETSLVGAAYAGARALGWEPDGWRPEVLETLFPEPKGVAALDEGYNRFLEVASVLVPLESS